MVDVRIANSKNRMQGALINLMRETPFADITTKQIIDEAEVSRKTFYAHYKDKSELLGEIEDQIADALQQALIEDRKTVLRNEYDLSDPKSIAKMADDSMYRTVQVCNENRAVVHVMLSDNGDAALLPRLQEIGRKELLVRTKEEFHVKKFKRLVPLTEDKSVMVPFDYILELYLNSFYTLLFYWLRSKDPISPSAIRSLLVAAQIQSPLQLITKGIESTEDPEHDQAVKAVSEHDLDYSELERLFPNGKKPSDEDDLPEKE